MRASLRLDLSQTDSAGEVIMKDKVFKILPQGIVYHHLILLGAQGQGNQPGSLPVENGGTVG